MIYSSEPISAEQLSPAQMFFIGLLEDARIEYKATSAFPGLKNLWLNIMQVPCEEEVEHPSMPVLAHFAQMLLDRTSARMTRR